MSKASDTCKLALEHEALVDHHNCYKRHLDAFLDDWDKRRGADLLDIASLRKTMRECQAQYERKLTEVTGVEEKIRKIEKEIGEAQAEGMLDEYFEKHT